ncbi:MAG: sulfotransferase [Gemmatimonadota bacterium]|nr:sulfotransferase [Gemmatimonadota bacterium]
MSSPSDFVPVFVIGSGRSGTTWLQLLLSQHPSVATCQETHLFTKYLGPLDRTWRAEANDPGPRRVGLPQTFDESDFDEACRAIADRLMRRILADKPGATVALEKTPGHAQEWRLIRRIYPHAYLVHMVRDPRAVVASLKSAGASWGSRWASRSAEGAVRQWETLVLAALEARGTDRYREVRYEDLLEDGPRILSGIFDWLGLDATLDDAEAFVHACRIDRLQKGDGPASPWKLDAEPADFYRKGQADSWKDDLEAPEIRLIESMVPELMRDLGYATSSPPGRIPLGALVRRALRPARARAASMLASASRRLQV